MAIERDGEVIMPNGETTIQAGDLVTVLSQQGDAQELVEVFTGPTQGSDTEQRGPATYEM